MIQKLKMLALSFSTTIMLVLPSLATATVTAAPQPAQPTNDFNSTDIHNGLCAGSNGDVSQTPTNTKCADTQGDTLNEKIGKAINVISAIVGIAAVIMIIVGGFRYITSAGKQESVQGAKNTLLYAIVGLVIVALAQLIVHFVINASTTSTG